jgi:hypothetical protein
MLYTVLIYTVEGVFDRLPPDEPEAVLAKHRALQEKLSSRGVLGPVAKLMGAASAVTVRADGESVLVTDGPYAETKEHLLGFYMIECACIEEAIEAAKALPQGVASYEVRPVSWANPVAAAGPPPSGGDG